MATKVAVVGAGSWGTAVAAIAATRTPTVLWARRPDLADRINAEHLNRDYLADFPLPPGLHATSSLEEALADAAVVVMGVPSHGFRDILTEARPHLPANAPIVSLTKGVEQDSLKRMTQVIEEVAPDRASGVLTGPNLAKEIMAGQPAASVVAMTDQAVAADLQQVFSTDAFRVYTNDDVVGCELAGALKNVMAIASGMADGMGFGDNTRAALITRGLAELTRLGCALGGQALTFSGLAGMGDLVATCISRQSRNRHVGEQLGQGRTIDEVIAEMKMVAEGVKTSRAVVALARQAGLEMPIAEQVVAVLYEGKKAVDIIPSLMRREAKPELHGITR
ncbi:MAG: glycerol-3-phosphate dehydrogenase [Acidimicrobiaceae bacterium]|nr:glycerol-3-phosphate dehydrogenase [Acidimicrobiaceae bacterium]MDQ1446346.1 glycerol-3-phosphate dehydrogenase [Acidimicrobiaceae bacterium]